MTVTQIREMWGRQIRDPHTLGNYTTFLENLLSELTEERKVERGYKTEAEGYPLCKCGRAKYHNYVYGWTCENCEG